MNIYKTEIVYLQAQKSFINQPYLDAKYVRRLVL